jgi:FAD/FMN-containing dehydrogenase
MSTLSRRTALRLLGGTGAAAVLGGCTQDPVAAPAGAVASSGPAQVARTASPAPADWARLAGSLHGKLLRPDTNGFAAAARLYNPRFDALPRPAAIARCANAADVQSAVRFVADTGTAAALRCGGHSYGGWSMSTGLVIDVAPINAVTVDTAAGTARIGAGARLADVYAALAAKGVALAAGSCPTVGISGLTLGGGVGVLTRAWGLTCDAVTGVEIVTADGQIRQVDARRDADLFWAVRGGGTGFGAVTAWTVRTRPAPTVQTFYYAWDIGRAHDVFTAWQRWISGTDPNLWSTCKLLADPGKDRVRITVSGTWIGAASALDAQLAPLLRQTGEPDGKQNKTFKYADAMLFEAGCSGQSATQCATAALGAEKRQAFAATSAIAGAVLTSAAIDTAIARTRAAMDVPKIIQGGVSFDALGGAVAQVAADATAFPHRGALAVVQFTATWQDGATAPDPFDAYVRGFRTALQPSLGDAAYANYADASIERYGAAYWGANYPRLQQVSAAVDPGGLFASAQSARPNAG